MGPAPSDGPTKRLLLVRGGVLTPYSGLGGAFHDLRTDLESGAFAPWSSAGTVEYDLGPSPGPLTRLMKRWYGHPRHVRGVIKRLHETGSVDLVLVSDQEQAHLVPRSAPVKVAVYVHDFFHLYPTTITLSGDRVEVGDQRPSAVRRRDLRRLKQGLARADVFFCNTAATAELCAKHFPSTPLYRIPYALDVAKFAPPEVLPAAPAGMSPERCHLLVVGSHDPRKRLTFLVEVLAGLPEEVRKDVLVHHIGSDVSPAGHANISEVARQRGVAWQHVGGNISDETLNLYRWYGEALLFPSAAEGFGYPPVESMAAGQPVLASDRPAHNELMPEGTCLPADDLDAWRQAVAGVHAAWKTRAGAWRSPVPELMGHVAFLAPERFHRDMVAAWDEISSS